MSKKITLTQGKVAIVDDDDFDWLNQFKWFAKKECGIWYACRNGSRKIEPRPYYRMHRYILSAKDEDVIDHINGNGLDNRKCNIRIVTPRENSQNRHHSRTSKYPGVCWHYIANRWLAQIRIKDKMKFLGYFENELDAAKAYKNACKDLQ